MSFRDDLAVLVGRIGGATHRLFTGRESTALPGYVAERLGNDPLHMLVSKRRYRAIICITGTNGKTTTTLLTRTALEQAGYVVVNNSSGSNLYRGILTTIMHDVRQGYETILLLEVDEASMPRVMQAVRPTHCVVLNLFRDQLDRYGEVDTTRQLLETAFQKYPSLELILNADDPHVANLGLHQRAKYFGLDLKGLKALPHDHAADVPLSPITGSVIEYRQRYFGHVGIWQAIDGSVSRPQRSLRVVESEHRPDGQKLTIKMGKIQHTLSTNLTGAYSLYNVAATTLLMQELGVSIENVQKAMLYSRTAFGRQEILHYQGAQLTFFLIKNPTGFNQVIQSHLQSNARTPLLFIINDNFADGRDISWLWDAAIEDMHIRGRILVSGSRAYDMALRLEYAGFACEVEMDVAKALQRLAEISAEGAAYVMPTYTALLQCRKLMSLDLEHK